MTNAVAAGLAARGVGLTPLLQDELPVRVSWNVEENILGTRALIVIPDIHFANGGDGDVFADGDGTARDRFARLVDAIVSFKASYEASGGRLSVLQLGDLYDVWRAYPEYVDHPTSDYRVIEDAYGAVIDKLVGAADARVCVGNHDATLALYPPSWARGPNGPNGRLAYAQSFVQGKVLGFHGHQIDQLVETMGGQAGAGAARLASIVAKLSNPLSQLLQRGVDFTIDFFADPSQFLEIADRSWPRSSSLSDTQVFSCPRWCDRDGTEHLRAVLSGMAGASTVRLAFIGHSHRAGVTAVSVGGRIVPVIDVGSWVWGASQIAIAVEGEAALFTVS